MSRLLSEHACHVVIYLGNVLMDISSGLFVLPAGLLRRGGEAGGHRPPPEGRDRGAHRRGPPPAAGGRRSFLLLEQQRETRETNVSVVDLTYTAKKRNEKRNAFTRDCKTEK